jgi:hypothetical protein
MQAFATHRLIVENPVINFWRRTFEPSVAPSISKVSWDYSRVRRALAYPACVGEFGGLLGGHADALSV